MSRTTATGAQGQLGSLIISALFVIAGVITLYDTLSYTDRDSQVFPQTVAIILIICASISFIMGFLNPKDEDGFSQGSWWRSVLLISTMFLCCLAMPKIGFLPAAVIAFAGGLIAAMHDRWSLLNILIYWVAGAVVMIAFFTLFKFVLNVPLP